MRRPTVEDCGGSDGTAHLNDNTTTNESRFSKVKRILSGTLTIGRSHSRKQNENEQKKAETRKRDHSKEHFGERDSEISCIKRKEVDKNLARECLNEIYCNNETIASYINNKQLISDEFNQNEKHGRKRKERHESIGSLQQERKLIRSSSEERPVSIHDDSSAKDIRRVSSHEDFKKNPVDTTEDCTCKLIVQKEPLHEIVIKETNIKANGTCHVNNQNNKQNKADTENIPVNETNEKNVSRNFFSSSHVSPNRDPRIQFYAERNAEYESEHEKRRSSERFSRPMACRGRTGKKRKNIKENNNQNIVKETSITSETKRSELVVDSNKNKTDQLHPVASYKNLGDEKPIQANVSPKSPKVVKNHDKIIATPQLDQNINSPLPEIYKESHSEKFDFKSLHKQIDDVEPIRMSYLYNVETTPTQSKPITSNRVLLSPRNSIILTRRTYMNPDIPIHLNKLDMPIKECVPQNFIEVRAKQISKQIASLKKKIKKYDETFDLNSDIKQSMYEGYGNDKKMKMWILELGKLKKELKCLRNSPLPSPFPPMITPDHLKDEKANMSRIEFMKFTFGEVQKRLIEKRQNTDRTEDIDQMTSEQLVDEKVAVQKALLYFESVHGRPVEKEERDLVRPLYDRYRILKRLVARAANSKLNSSISELATILENETMDFVSVPIQENAEPDTNVANVNVSTDSSDTDTSINENLHALPIEDLIEVQKVTQEEKKKLRKALKDFEHDFQIQTGRRLQKDERTPMESTYKCYKQAKAKLRLLEALLIKQIQTFP